MTDHITLPRAVVEQVLEFLEKGDFLYPAELSDNLHTALAEPVQEPDHTAEIERAVALLEPEIEKLREDANRYLWLRQIDKPEVWSALLDRRVVCALEALDSAINDAMLES